MTKLEEVAKALYDQNYLNSEDSHYPSFDESRFLFLPLAKVAVEAMRVPTDAMIKSAHEHHEGEFYLPFSLWQSMIDALLNEAPTHD